MSVITQFKGCPYPYAFESNIEECAKCNHPCIIYAFSCNKGPCNLVVNVYIMARSFPECKAWLTICRASYGILPLRQATETTFLAERKKKQRVFEDFQKVTKEHARLQGKGPTPQPKQMKSVTSQTTGVQKPSTKLHTLIRYHDHWIGSFTHTICS